MADAAVIFDVDGVLLDLTPPEEDAFFHPFLQLHGLSGLSRDSISRLRRSAKARGANLKDWFASFEPIEASQWQIVEVWLNHAWTNTNPVPTKEIIVSAV